MRAITTEGSHDSLVEVERVWVGEEAVTVVCAPGAWEGHVVARRRQDGTEVAASATVDADRYTIRVELAGLASRGPEPEDWDLAGPPPGLRIAAEHEDVPDKVHAFAFPARVVAIDGVPRRFRVHYTDDGGLAIRSTRVGAGAGRATGSTRPPPSWTKRLGTRARAAARLAAHRLVRHAVAAALRRRLGARASGQRARVVILLGHAWGVGGTTRTTLSVAGHLAEHHEVEILSMVRGRERAYFDFPEGVRVTAVDDQRPRRLRGLRRIARGVLRRLPTVLLLPTDRRMSKWATLWTDVLLIRALWRLRADVLMGTRPALNALAADLSGPTLVAVGQEHINLGSHRPALRTELLRRYRRLDAVVTLTEQDRGEYEAALGDAGRVVAIPNAVPPLPGPASPLDGHTVVAVGRLARQKGFDLLIPAFAQVVREHPDWTLRICGGGRQRKALATVIAEHELYNHVLLLGPVENVERQLERASAFVLSSRFEGLPMAMIEAMSKGLPVAAFDCPTGPREVLEDGRSGLLVSDGDTDALARAILELVADPERRRELGAAAAVRAARFSMDRIGPRWDALLAELLTNSRSTAKASGVRPPARGTEVKPLPADYDVEAKQIIRAARPYTMTAPDKLFALILAARYVSRHAIPGAVVECGVWRGGSMQAAARALLDCGDASRDLYLFDTFEGMPPPGDRDVRHDGRPAAELLAIRPRDHDVWAVATLEDVRAAFAQVPYPAERVHFVKGLVEDTIPTQAPESISILRLDTDWYASTRHELEHLYERLSPGGVLLIDDYGWWKGAREAVDEFLEHSGERLLLLRMASGRIAVKP